MIQPILNTAYHHPRLLKGIAAAGLITAVALTALGCLAHQGLFASTLGFISSTGSIALMTGGSAFFVISIIAAATYMAWAKRQEDLLGMKLNAWHQQAPTEVRENYNTARRRILDFVNNSTNALKLNDLKLLTLPDIFDHSAFSQLQTLDLDDNQLQALPASISALSQLQRLWLNNNQLRALPDSISALSQLQKLGLINNQLQTLPAFISVLSQLHALDLGNNQLQALPDSISALSQLQWLNLDNNRFQEFPASISALSQLQWLWLNNNQLRALPDSISALSQLQKLWLSDNQLRALPDSISALSQLQELWLSDNQLQVLPDSIGALSQLQWLWLNNNQLQALPDSISALSQLQKLWLSDNQLRALPDSISALSQLQWLELSNNRFQEFPASISALSQLQKLGLSDNQLRALPDSISAFSQLRTLNLKGNTSLSSLPNAILLLPQGCTVYLDDTGLSMEVLTRLREATRRADYQGPRFFFSISDSRGDEMLPLEQLLKKLFFVAEQTKRELPNFLKTETLHSWLSRFFKIGNLKNGGERQKVLANKILGYLSLAEENEEFRNVFLRVLDEASATCGDRVLLSILRLGTQYRLARIELNVAKVSELLKGIWALSLLEDCAQNKVATLRFVDEIEVHLAFPVKLKERLNLPIDVEDMLYFPWSKVTEEDLQEAEGHVRKMWDNKKAYVDFLIQQPKWLETLKVSYPEKYGEIERAKENASEEDNPNYDAIANSEKQALKELSEKALQSSYPLKN